MFELTIVPKILYDSEVWGFANIEFIERIHLRFCKILPKLRKSNTCGMVYVEVDRLSLARCVQARIINFLNLK